MPLDARKADLDAAWAQLQTTITNCKTDVAASDPDTNEILRIMELAQSAMLAGGVQPSEGATVGPS